MIEFFRDVISGPVYVVAVIFSIIFIMAIIGFLMERKKLEKEHNEQVAVINNNQNVQNIPNVQPINPVTVENEVVITPIEINELPTSNIDENQSLIVNQPTIVFSDPDQTQE